MIKSPHFWWLISILVLTIIALIAFIITDRIICNVKLMEYISVCSTLLSITLSIFAIQYTYTSNNEIHQQFDKINFAADNIKGTSENLASTNALLKENLEKILENLEDIGESQRLMTSQIENINKPQSVTTTFSNIKSPESSSVR